MTITQYEQSGVLITSASGQALAIDIGALTPLESLTDTIVDAMQPSVVYTGAAGTFLIAD